MTAFAGSACGHDGYYSDLEDDVFEISSECGDPPVRQGCNAPDGYANANPRSPFQRPCSPPRYAHAHEHFHCTRPDQQPVCPSASNIRRPRRDEPPRQSARMGADDDRRRAPRGSTARGRASVYCSDPLPANIILPTLSLEQLMEDQAVSRGDIVGRSDVSVQHLLEEFSALCPGDQITMLRCLASSFYRDALFAPYAALHLIRTRMRVMYAREVIHEADDLADALTSDTTAFMRHRRRILEAMLEEEMDVYRYLVRSNEDIDEENLLSAVETLLRRFRRMGCYRSLCMLKILALQHEDLGVFIRRRIAHVRGIAHQRTHTVLV